MKPLYPLILFLLTCSTNPFKDICGVVDGDGSTCIDTSIIDSYQLKDLNITSATFGETLSHNNFLGKVILYYFPSSDTWGLCKSRFDSLYELYLDYGGLDSEIVIIGVGKNDGNLIYTVAEDTIFPYIKETDGYILRYGLGVVDRDVYFYDSNGIFANKVNLTASFERNMIEGILDDLLN